MSRSSEALEADLVEARAIADACMEAAQDESYDNDFMLSFPQVRAVADLRLMHAEEAALRERLGQLLTGVADAIKGAPGPLQMHDWSDLPERAARLVAERDAALKEDRGTPQAQGTGMTTLEALRKARVEAAHSAQRAEICAHLDHLIELTEAAESARPRVRPCGCRWCVAVRRLLAVEPALDWAAGTHERNASENRT